MDFDSPDPDVEKEFPGLFASESAANRKKDEDDCKFLLKFCSTFIMTRPEGRIKQIEIS